MRMNFNVGNTSTTNLIKARKGKQITKDKRESMSKDFK